MASDPSTSAGPTRSIAGYDLTPITQEERARLASALSPEEQEVLLAHGTERPFCGGLLNQKEAGTYACRLCGLPLFRSSSKFESGTGWPSFYEKYDPDHISNIEDRSYGMLRVEIRCGKCDSHLGHVFPDGPEPTGLRYCLNSVALEFFPEGREPIQKARAG